MVPAAVCRLAGHLRGGQFTTIKPCVSLGGPCAACAAIGRAAVRPSVRAAFQAQRLPWGSGRPWRMPSSPRGCSVAIASALSVACIEALARGGCLCIGVRGMRGRCHERGVVFQICTWVSGSTRVKTSTLDHELRKHTAARGMRGACPGWESPLYKQKESTTWNVALTGSWARKPFRLLEYSPLSFHQAPVNEVRPVPCCQAPGTGDPG